MADLILDINSTAAPIALGEIKLQTAPIEIGNLGIVLPGPPGRDGAGYTLPAATADTLGGVKVGDNLKIENGILSVDTTTNVSQDNTKPVTSAAVHVQLGNVEVLLAAL